MRNDLGHLSFLEEMKIQKHRWMNKSRCQWFGPNDWNCLFQHWTLCAKSQWPDFLSKSVPGGQVIKTPPPLRVHLMKENHFYIHELVPFCTTDSCPRCTYRMVNVWNTVDIRFSETQMTRELFSQKQFFYYPVQNDKEITMKALKFFFFMPNVVLTEFVQSGIQCILSTYK